MFKRILVPTDGSDITPQAIDTAIALAKSVECRDPHDLRQGAVPVRRDLRDAADAAAGVLRCAGADRDAPRRGGRRSLRRRRRAVPGPHDRGLHPWESIIEHAKKTDCDLLVMASHGRRGVSALLLGSETQKVLTHTKIPVLVVR